MEYLTVGEVAERSGLPISTIHFWESKGLIRSTRSEGNQRRFARPELRRIAVIKIGQRAGIPLGEIRSVLDTLPADRAVSARSWAALSNRWKRSLDARSRALPHCAINSDSVSVADAYRSTSAGFGIPTT